MWRTQNENEQNKKIRVSSKNNTKAFDKTKTKKGIKNKATKSRALITRKKIATVPVRVSYIHRQNS
jgi:hypothetical protein